jgi:quinoprotein glucose dehydrogenase
VPDGAAGGTRRSPTQPVPVRPPPLVRTSLAPHDAFGLTLWDRGLCREALSALRSEGLFTPPAASPVLVYPGNAGGVSWGGVAFSPGRALAVANATDVAWVIEPGAAGSAGERSSPAGELPVLLRRPLRSPLGLPCNPPPWGWLGAWDLASGTLRWRVPLGTIRDLAPLPLPLPLGTPNAGGPIVTAGGLVFIGAAADDYLRAFDLESGEELWRGRLPAGGQATPMTYLGKDGRQFVVIAAGGHAPLRTRAGDSVVAFALPP